MIRVNEEDVVLVKSLANLKNIFRRQLAIASVITKIFKYNGLIDPVIVGGSVVALYSQEQYKTVDLDMKSESVEAYTEILSKLGYIKRGKDFFHKELDSYIEFPSGEMQDSWDHMREYIIEETGLPIYVIGFEDLILDRVGSFVSTNDLDSKEWAIRLMGMLYADIDWSYLHKKANRQGTLKVVEKLQREVKRLRKLYQSTREESQN